ncbi:MAG: hypothetical protein K6G64_04185 [Eubacterium sp.]|nr:hypothetical protein [Eubacterium sp.]
MKKIKLSILYMTMILSIGALTACGTPEKKEAKVNDGMKKGTWVVYEVQAGTNPKDLEDTRAILEKRAKSLYTPDAKAYLQEDDKIKVNIPEKYDIEEQLDELAKPGKLFFTIKAKDGYEPTKEELESESYIKLNETYYKVWLTGNDVEKADAATQIDDEGITENVINVSFNSEGADKFSEMTSSNVGVQNFIILDEQEVVSPMIAEAITCGACVISGCDSIGHASVIAAQINSGCLKAEVKKVDCGTKK